MEVELRYLWMSKFKTFIFHFQTPFDSAEMAHESLPIPSLGLPILEHWPMIVFLIRWFIPSLENIPRLFCFFLVLQNFQDLCYLHNSGSLSYHSSRLSCFMLNAFRVHTLNPRPDQGPGSPQWPLFTSPHFYRISMSVKKKKKLLSLRTVLQWFLKQWNFFFQKMKRKSNAGRIDSPLLYIWSRDSFFLQNSLSSFEMFLTTLSSVV